MKLLKTAFSLTLLLITFAAKADDALPPVALDTEYQACLGQGAADENKQKYCACVRDELAAELSVDQAEQFGAAHAAGKDDPSELAKIQSIGNDCIAKTLKQ